MAITMSRTAVTGRRELAAAHRLAAQLGLSEGTWNHISLKVPGAQGRILLTPPYTHFSRVKASNLIELSREDRERLRHGNPHPWTGYLVHLPLHEARDDVKCVIHVHSPHATALASLEKGRLEPVTPFGAETAGRIAYTEDWDGHDPWELEKGAEIARALGDCDVLLLRNHGVVVVGDSVAQAFLRCYQLERACEVQLIAESSGRRLAQIATPPVSAAHDAPAMRKSDSELHFAGLCAMLDHLEPDYTD
jgi:ribulose-5-phosphate 4-epimerase/fuculose-1-phosphate aldolase